MPRHQLIDAIDLVIRQTFEHPGQPSFGIDVIHLGCFDERIGDGSGLATADGAHEQVVFAAQGDGAD